MKRVWLLAPLAACSFHPNAAPGGPGDAEVSPADAARAPDAPPAIDAPSTSPDAPDPTCGWGFRPTNFDPCALPSPAGSVSVTAATTIDPATTELPHAMLAQADGTMIEVIHLTSLTVPVGTRLTIAEDPGVAGVVLAVDGGVSIDGMVAAAAGADDPIHCATATGQAGSPSGANSDGAGGGGGGAASADGGDGGDGGGAQKGAHGKHGTHVGGATSLSPLRGGCAGGAGAIIASGSKPAAAGGHGGGALEISSRVSVSVGGALDASGRGGTGAAGGGYGGGGGGAGGGILLEAPAVSIAGNVCADGGSGGEGGGAMATGHDGLPGACTGAAGATTPTTPNSLGGHGGDGGYRTTTAGGAAGPGKTSAGYDSGGGGGGGGAVGWIRLRATGGAPAVTGVVTPMPTTN